MIENIWTFGAASDKEANAMVSSMFSKELNNLKEKTYTDNAKLKLTKGDDGWTVDKIDADDDFMNVLSGDLLDTMDSLDSDE